MKNHGKYFAILAVFSLAVHASPTGVVVVSGSANLNAAGTTTTITTTSNAILNWHAFSIANGETVRFVQPSNASSVLNRVIGPDPSQIFGQLTSNGQVWLINPAGILVGPTGRIDTAGFVASTLNALDSDLLAGRFNLTGNAASGLIRNEGQINAGSASVYLIAPTVQNSGLISAPEGQVMLLAGHRVTLGNTETPGVFYEVAAPDTEAINLGTVAARGILLQGNQVSNSGELSASSAVREGGRIFLVGSKNVTLASTGSIKANGSEGGTVALIAGDKATVAGVIEAKGSSGSGGIVYIEGKQDIQQSATIRVDGSPMGAILTTQPLATEFSGFDPNAIGPDFMTSNNWTNGGFFNAGWEASNVTESGGIVTLAITPCSEGSGGCSGKPYAAGEVMSLSKLGYGTFSTRMKAATGSGVVSSFFLYSDNPSWEEIDIEFLGKDTTKVQFNYFRNGSGGNEQVIDLGFDAAAAFHDYAIRVEPGRVAWLVDGVEKKTVAGDVPFAPWRMIINAWPATGVDSWTGAYDGTPTSAAYDFMRFAPQSMAIPQPMATTGLGTFTLPDAQPVTDSIRAIEYSMQFITQHYRDQLSHAEELAILALKPEDGVPTNCERQGAVTVCNPKKSRPKNRH